MKIERDEYGRVVTMSPEAARQFFGQLDTVEVIDEGPPRDPERYKDGVRCYAVRISDEPART